MSKFPNPFGGSNKPTQGAIQPQVLPASYQQGGSIEPYAQPIQTRAIAPQAPQIQMASHVQRVPAPVRYEQVSSGDGGGKAIPIYAIAADDKLAAIASWRALGSSFRHRPAWAAGCTLLVFYTIAGVTAGVANVLRPSPQWVEKPLLACAFDPVCASTNLTTLARGPLGAIGEGVGDGLIEGKRPAVAPAAQQNLRPEQRTRVRPASSDGAI